MNSRVSRWLLRGWLAVVLSIGAGPALAQTQSWKFVVFGDSISVTAESGINTNILGELAAAVVKESPDFVLFLGDCAYQPSPASLSLWTNLMGAVYGAGIPVFPAVGNHEASDQAAFTNFFGPTLPANGPSGELTSTYFVRYRNALVLVFNEFAVGNQSRVNQGWVEAVLATNSQPHVIAAGHMPAFKLQHPDCLGTYPANRDILWNTLSNAHCRLYFCGHDHFYDHCRLDDGDGNPDNDLHQMTVGTGGAMLYADGAYDGTNGVWTPVRVYHDAQFGYVTVTITGDVVSTAWHYRTPTGAYAVGPDILTYSVVPPPRLGWSYSSGRLTLRWTGAGVLQSAPEPSGPFSEVVGASSPYSLEQVSGAQRFFRLMLQ